MPNQERFDLIDYFAFSCIFDGDNRTDKPCKMLELYAFLESQLPPRKAAVLPELCPPPRESNCYIFSSCLRIFHGGWRQIWKKTQFRRMSLVNGNSLLPGTWMVAGGTTSVPGVWPSALKRDRRRLSAS